MIEDFWTGVSSLVLLANQAVPFIVSIFTYVGGVQIQGRGVRTSQCIIGVGAAIVFVVIDEGVDFDELTTAVTCHAVGLAGDLVCPLVVIPATDEVWLGTGNQSTEGIILVDGGLVFIALIGAEKMKTNLSSS